MEYTSRIKSVGVDTLTVSAPWEGGSFSLIDLALWFQRDEQDHGSGIFDWKRGSYHGTTTQHAGIAFRPGRVLVEARGPLAWEFWPHLLDRAEKVSRIDVQVTAHQQPYDHEMAVSLWREARARATVEGRPSKYRLQGEADGGTTLYIGKGASRYQGRMYEASYKHPGEGFEECWRYELQCRRERAQQMADLLREADSPGHLASGAVWSYFARRGVAPIFSPGMAVNTPPLPDTETTKEKSLRWLASSVAPHLQRHTRWGSTDEAIRALGIGRTLENP